MKEPNKLHNNYETEKITRKASDAAEYIELFGSSTRDRHARCNNVILWMSADIRVVVHDDLGGRTEQLDIIAHFLPRHWLYEWFLSAENIRLYMRRASGGRTDVVIGFGEVAAVD